LRALNFTFANNPYVSSDQIGASVTKNFHGRTGPVTARKDSAMRGGPGTTEINNHLAMFAAATQIHDCGENVGSIVPASSMHSDGFAGGDGRTVVLVCDNYHVTGSCSHLDAGINRE